MGKYPYCQSGRPRKGPEVPGKIPNLPGVMEKLILWFGGVRQPAGDQAGAHRLIYLVL